MALSGPVHFHISAVTNNLHLIVSSPQNVVPTSHLKSHCCGHPKYPITATVASASAPQGKGDASPLSALSTFHSDFLMSTQFPVPTQEWMNRAQRDDLEGNAKDRQHHGQTQGQASSSWAALWCTCVFCNMHGRKPISCWFPCSCWHQRASGSV